MKVSKHPFNIPNTMVKTKAAEGTTLETAWKYRWLPVFFGKDREEEEKQSSSELIYIYSITVP